MLKPEKRVAYIKLYENDRREINSAIVHYNDGSKETIASNKISKESR